MCSFYSELKYAYNFTRNIRQGMGAFYFILCFILISATFGFGQAEGNVKKNIVFIIADDLGWNDVSLHGSDQILTPNIDSLGFSGVTLGRYYSHCVCTPSRSALLTGKYAHKLGMQGYPLTNSEDRGLSVTEKILPQYLKELGYATHLVGKWHVGGSRRKYLPTKRGFDTHFGHRGGFIDYYEYTLEETWDTGKVSGMGLFRDEVAAWDVEGYITDLYNEEAISIIRSHDQSKPLFLMLAHNAPHGADEGAILEAPPHEVRAMRHVESPARRIYAAMMKKLDDSVGDVIEALEEKCILNNTIIVFISDNGAKTSGNSINYGSNWPLRGIKMSPFEGAVRVTGAIWAPINISSHFYEGYIHVTDWLPTLLAAIGEDSPPNLDGINLWDEIIKNKNSSRDEIIEIDDYEDFASIISGDYKLVTGTVNKLYSDYQGGDMLGIIGKAPNYIEALQQSKAFKAFNKIGTLNQPEYTNIRNKLKIKCDQQSVGDICYPAKDKICLYNIKEDPCERQDISEKLPDVVEKLKISLMAERRNTIPRTVPLYRDPRSKPALFNYTWTTFAEGL